MQRRMTKRFVTIALLFVALLGAGPAALSAGPAAVEQAKIYMIAEGDEGESGEPVGCGDSLVPVTRDIPSGLSTQGKIAELLQILFSLNDPYYGQSGFRNAVADSNLSVDGVAIQGNTAVIYLSGTVSVAGVCDEPRVDGQIAAIARQFAGITNVIIILNGGPLFNNVGSIDFPITGHSVAPPFFPYWEAQGGLPIFGYPLSDQLVEGGFRAQYFERQRLEAHPENAAPYNVLFGLVGSQAAAERGLLGTAPFAPATQQGGANCEYFAETRHNVCGLFRTYWHSYGLDFGEAGFSARESLALFGFPISEQFQEQLEIDDQGTLATFTVQYFERVRMEIHTNPNTNQQFVLLGRLTADLVPPTP